MTPRARIVGRLADLAGPLRRGFRATSGAACTTALRAFPEAVAALRAFRAGGGRVVFVTNAPRPRASVAAQIARLGIPDDAWDAIATSGDAARAALFQGVVGTRVWYMGEATDLAFFEPPRIVEDPVPVERVDLDEAHGIVCCGPFDPHADPEVNRPDFERAIARGLHAPLRQPRHRRGPGRLREFCAGALARLYEAMGGTALYFGKPHAPIYALARQRLAALGPLPPDGRILAIGDGPATDAQGAAMAGLDCLFVAGGLAAAETATPPGGQPDPDRLAAFLAAERLAPRWAIGFLR